MGFTACLGTDRFVSALLTSATVVAIAEIGDKTQLLSLFLAARYRRPSLIILAILIATVANHAVAAWAGDRVAAELGPQVLRWTLGLSFLGIACWALRPDSLDCELRSTDRFGVFVTAFLAFFLAEMGDKTQLATVALAARYSALDLVLIGTTLGMIVANVPAVLLGERIMKRFSLKLMRWLAAGSFAALGGAVLFGLDA